MKRKRNGIITLLVTLMMVLVLIATACSGGKPSAPATKAATPTFTIMWSVYVGWQPWPYAQQSGILKKWADKYNIEIDLKRADYIPSIEAYVAGQADGVAMTNMEALNMAAAAGVDSTCIIIGDYSNGNDAVLTRNGLKLQDLKGKEVYIVELSVSQYLLERGLAIQNGIGINDIKLINTSDADISPAFIANSSQQAVVTWNPMVLDILTQVPGVTDAFDSSKIPYEILDIMFLKTETLNRHPELAKALVGAWYETMGIMTTPAQPTRESAFKIMAEEAGTTVTSFKKQLETTAMFWTPKDAAEFTRSNKLVEVMDLVRKFSFDHGLWTTKTVDDIGIEFPGGKTLGNTKNIKLRFTDTYMQMAADGKL